MYLETERGSVATYREEAALYFVILCSINTKRDSRTMNILTAYSFNTVGLNKALISLALLLNGWASLNMNITNCRYRAVGTLASYSRGFWFESRPKDQPKFSWFYSVPAGEF